jgi:hypothetical protein
MRKTGGAVRGIDYYELLGVHRDASPSEIRSAYRSLAKAMHPDSGGTAGAFRLLHEAYETLTDPDRRDSYDNVASVPVPPRQRQRQRRARRVGDDPDHVPTLPTIDPDTIGWWQTARGTGRVTLFPLARPSREVTLAALGGWVLLLVLLILIGPPVPLLVVWLLMLAGSGAAVWRLGRRRLAADRVDQEFTTEFGTRAVFGSPGTDADQVAEQLTADLTARYLTRIPGVRIFHGLAAEVGSVFADIDHAVLCGNRLVLIESKRWLPGHYDVDDTGGLRRNGHRFRGGTIRLPDGVAAYRRIAPGLEVRGVLLLYPSRAGEITVGDQPTDFPPMVPDRFVQEIGAWLAADPSTVDRQAFRAVLGQVVSPT